MKLIFKYYLLFTLVLIGLVACKRQDYSDTKETNIESTIVPANSINFKKQDVDSLHLTAEIVGIQDGDTVEALYNGELLMKVRLAHIDAPEKRKSQPFGKASKKALSNLCFGQTVELVSKGKGERDRYGRLIAVIKNSQKVNCNRQMVRLGLAWHYKKFSESKIYADLENKAREEKIGLWRDPNAIAPWNWRKH